MRSMNDVRYPEERTWDDLIDASTIDDAECAQAGHRDRSGKTNATVIEEARSLRGLSRRPLHRKGQTVLRHISGPELGPLSLRSCSDIFNVRGSCHS